MLSHSGWRYAEVVAGETFLALKQGLQKALWALGGAPLVIRSDNTSALTHEMKRSRGRALNDAYAELLDHYGLRSTLINAGESHENGVAEQAHYRLKDALDQALMLRGSRDFDSAGENTPASSGRRWTAATGWYGGSWSRNELICNPCRQLLCRNTSTTGPGCASGAPSRQLAAPTLCPPGSSGRRCRSGCTPNTWKCTTRTTWWNGWNVSEANGRPASITFGLWRN